MKLYGKAFRFVSLLVILAFFSSMAASCGGGGGSNTSNSNDNTVPEITSSGIAWNVPSDTVGTFEGKASDGKTLKIETLPGTFNTPTALTIKSLSVETNLQIPTGYAPIGTTYFEISSPNALTKMVKLTISFPDSLKDSTATEYHLFQIDANSSQVIASSKINESTITGTISKFSLFLPLQLIKIPDVLSAAYCGINTYAKAVLEKPLTVGENPSVNVTMENQLWDISNCSYKYYNPILYQPGYPTGYIEWVGKNTSISLDTSGLTMNPPKRIYSSFVTSNTLPFYVPLYIGERTLIIDRPSNVAELTPLIEKYMPVLKFSQGENYKPIDVSLILQPSVLNLGISDIFLNSDFAYTLSVYGNDNSSISMGTPIQNVPTIYATAINNEQGITAISYWMFYEKDSKPGPLGHAGDWELFIAFLDQNNTPFAGTSAAHDGKATVSWSEIEKENDRPVLYIAKDSHATYPHKCVNDLSACFGDYVPGDGETLSTYQLKIMPRLTEIDAHSPWAWLLFPGKVGKDWNSPKMPPFNGDDEAKWLNPVKWVGITINTHTISGKVTNFTGSALQGVTITLTGSGSTSTITDWNGNYNFTGAQNGSYTITPSTANYTFNPPNRPVTVNNADVTGQDFVGSATSNVLEGTWKGYEVNGETGWTMTFSGSQVDISDGSHTEWYKGTFSLDTNSAPQKINMTITQSEYPEYIGKIGLGIYKIEGNTLTLAANEPGNAARPSSFTANEVTRVYVLTKQADSGVITSFYDDFSGDLSKWSLFGSPQSGIVSSVHGRSGVFDNNGDANNSSGAISKNLINCGAGCAIESDVYLDFSNLSGCWAAASIGKTRTAYANGSGYSEYISNFGDGAYFAIAADGDACWMTPASYRRHADFWLGIYAEDGTMEISPAAGTNLPSDWYGVDWTTIIQADSFANGWHTMKILINADRIVKFYIDNNLIWQPTKKIHPSVLQSTNLVLGARSSGSAGKAYHDWLKVSQ